MERATVLLVLAVIAVNLTTCSAQDTECSLSDLASRGDCNFYRCLELQNPCGSSEYALGYGYKYCKRFTTYINDFNSEGRQWVNNVRRCLMDSLASYMPSERSCSEITTYAFNSHPECYLSSSPGFCEIAFSNLEVLCEVFDLTDFLSWQALEQVFETLYGCARGKRDTRIQDIITKFKNLKRNASR